MVVVVTLVEVVLLVVLLELLVVLLELLDVVAVVVVAVVDVDGRVVLVVVVLLAVVVVGTGQVQPAWQMSAPPALPQVALPGGSHCSPPSRSPLPHTGPAVVLVELDVVAVVVVAVVDVDGRVVLVAVVDVDGRVVLVVVVLLAVVVVAAGQVQSPWQRSAPPALPQVALPGGSHCSLPSIFPLPQTSPAVVLVELDVVAVVVVDVLVVVLPPGQVQSD